MYRQSKSAQVRSDKRRVLLLGVATCTLGVGDQSALANYRCTQASRENYLCIYLRYQGSDVRHKWCTIGRGLASFSS